LLFPTGDCLDLDLGMESGSIPDNKITASSQISHAKNGRLNREGSWCASTSDSNPYLEIDLQTFHIICAVSTQGDSLIDNWVKTYSLQISTDGTFWTNYNEFGKVKIFSGNDDRETEKTNIIHEGLLTRWLRFVAKRSHNKFCMRIELYGVKQKPDNLATGRNAYPHLACCSTSENTLYSHHNCSQTAANNSSWWRVDLGSDHVSVSEVLVFDRRSQALGHRSKSFILTLGNLAYGKQTDQVSTYTVGSSGRAVDGDSSTNDFSADLTCSHTMNGTPNPWWRVDLGRVESVTEVYIVNRGDCCGARLSSFEIRVGTSTVNGGVNNPTCGRSNYSVPQGKGASFFCRPSLPGRYVTIRSTLEGTHPLTLCEVEVYSARRACQIQALGVTSRDAFPDSSLSASTSRARHEPFKARLLNENGAWSPSSDLHTDDYLQINLHYEFFICAVATQGNPVTDHWTTKYKLRFSLDSINWHSYQENNTDKIFHGNNGRNDTVKNNLVKLTRARYIRFQPVAYSTHKALRVEVYGVLKPTVPNRSPDSFVVVPLTSTGVRAAWKLPPSASWLVGSITGFKLLYKRKSSVVDPLRVETIESNSTLSINVTGLGKYTEYEFQVLAFSSAGDGPRSPIILIRTFEDVPSQAPVSFTLNAVSSTSITASWQLPPAHSRNGNITGFKLFYEKEDPAGSPVSTIIMNDGAIRVKTVTRLDKHTEYEFKILAFTSVGDGPTTTVRTMRTKEGAGKRS
ncbi:unnamed protein product, partial [Porites evermanni]